MLRAGPHRSRPRGSTVTAVGKVDGGALSGSVGAKATGDLKDAAWAPLVPLIPGATHGGRPRKTNLARGDERPFCNVLSAGRPAVALSAARQLSTTFDDLQRFPRVRARGGSVLISARARFRGYRYGRIVGCMGLRGTAWRSGANEDAYRASRDSPGKSGLAL